MHAEPKTSVLARRDALDAVTRATLSRAITAHLISSPFLAQARTIMAYASFRSEVDSSFLVAHFLGRGRRVVFPRCRKGEKGMDLHAVEEPAGMRAGAYGILEPDPALHPLVPAASVDAVLTPGSVFCADGGRLGYGGGYYDRFLATEAPAALRIGLCFSLQVVEKLRRQPHDEAMDLLVTELGLVVCRPGRRRFA